MFTSREFTTAIASASEQLDRARQMLIAIACPQIEELQINLQDLTQDSIGELLHGVPSGYKKIDKDIDYVYVIRLQPEMHSLVPTLWLQLETARALAADYCRVNKENVDAKALYVGRSKKLKSRLTQHLGTEQNGIYSMHLQRWATSNDAKISISYMKFEKREDLLVQAIEDGIWSSLKPAFGRKGER
jgi:hypothetical protein